MAVSERTGEVYHKAEEDGSGGRRKRDLDRMKGGSAGRWRMNQMLEP